MSVALSAEPPHGDVPSRGASRLDDDAVAFAIELVERSGVVPQLVAWRAGERDRLGRHAGGRPAHVGAEALVVAMALAVIHDLAQEATIWRDILYFSISETMRERLDIERPELLTTRDQRNLHRCVLRTFHSLFDATDPSALPKNRRLLPEEFAPAVNQRRAERVLTDDELAVRYERLSWVMNQLIEASLTYLPADIRSSWQGSVAIDATFIPAYSRPERSTGRGPRRRVLEHAADPDAGMYVRSGPADPDLPRSARPIRKQDWGNEATLVVSGSDDPTRDSSIPNLTVATAPLQPPSTNISGAAMTALSSLSARGYPAGWLAGDRAYTNSVADDYQLPAQALGYRLVHDYRIDQLGVQGQNQGALFIEGAYYCPAIPERLIDATKDRRAGRIDEHTYQTRIEARGDYRMRSKELPDEEGHWRMLCPASDGAPTARCDLKPRSNTKASADKPRIILTEELRDNPCVCCEQQTITIPPEPHAKLRQDLSYGSPEWHSIYSTLRNGVEGMNAQIKDGGRSALGEPSRRRIRGITPQSVFVAFGLAATNLRAIESFVRDAKPDANGTRRRPRRRRTRSITDWAPHTTTAHAPP